MTMRRALASRVWEMKSKVVQLQARQHLLSEDFHFGLAIGVSLQGGRKFSARRENFPSVLLPFVPAPYPYFSVTRSLRKSIL